MKSIFITGGAGYVGHVLVPRLLKEHFVTVSDTCYFQNNLPSHKNLKIIKGDIRDKKKLELSCLNHKFLYIWHVSNDTSFELNESLSTSINMDAFEPMIKIKIIILESYICLLKFCLRCF